MVSGRFFGGSIAWHLKKTWPRLTNRMKRVETIIIKPLLWKMKTSEWRWIMLWLRLSRGDLSASLGDQPPMKTVLRLLTWERNDSVTSQGERIFLKRGFFDYFDAVLNSFKPFCKYFGSVADEYRVISLKNTINTGQTGSDWDLTESSSGRGQQVKLILESWKDVSGLTQMEIKSLPVQNHTTFGLEFLAAEHLSWRYNKDFKDKGKIKLVILYSTRHILYPGCQRLFFRSEAAIVSGEATGVHILTPLSLHSS